ncbi:uncharacterized protein [Nicotiana sylvestris]|uniref:uncharacterized protein n=1 Tax=Nicotiana sylvestris TaxID=4096 RepID=UPI00388C447A
MDLQLRIGATMEERAILEEWFPLNAHAQQLVGLGDGYKLPADEDVNIPKQSEAEVEKSDDGDNEEEEEEEEEEEKEAQDEEWEASEEKNDDAV